jgi:replicative DNA helicase
MADEMFEDLPHDIGAERYVLASMLTNAAAIDEVAEILVPEDFHRPGHQVAFRAMVVMRAQGIAVTPVTLRDELARHGEIQAVGGPRQGPIYLAELYALPVMWMAAGVHAQIVFDRAVRRAAIERATRVIQAARQMDQDPAEVAAAAAAEFGSVPARAVADPAGVPMTAGKFVKLATARSEPVIDGLLHREDRVIVVGEEGHGKSILTGQAAFRAAAGLHPWRSDVRFPGRRVLLVDLENPRAVMKDRVEMFSALAARHHWDPDLLTVWSWPQGLNLRRASDAHMLAEHIRRARPDLVVAGPVYKMTEDTGEHSEQTHSSVTRFWDQMRGRYGFALVMEHHPPLQTNMKAARIMRPAFSGVYSRWPEFGIALILTKGNTLELSRFRGDRIAGRSWPVEIQRHDFWGRDWPWKAVKWAPGAFSTPLEEAS